MANLNIKILGTRGEIKESTTYHSKKSGVLLDDCILIDCGEPQFIQYDPKYILITHLHPDHAYFVRHHEKPDIDVPIFAPEKYDLAKITVTSKEFMLDDYRITPIPTIHSIKVKSNAYLIEHKGKRIFFTGDIIWIEKKYHSLIGEIDLVITEASFAQKGGIIRRQEERGMVYGHNGVPDLIKLLKNFSATFLFIHFGAWFYKDINKSRHYFKTLAKENKIKIIIGYDGMELEI